MKVTDQSHNWIKRATFKLWEILFFDGKLGVERTALSESGAWITSPGLTRLPAIATRPQAWSEQKLNSGMISCVNFCLVTSISVSCLSCCSYDLNVVLLVQFWFWSVTKLLWVVFLILKFSSTWVFINFFAHERGLGHIRFKKSLVVPQRLRNKVGILVIYSHTELSKNG